MAFVPVRVRAAIAAVIALAACGPTAPVPALSAPEEGRAVRIVMREFAFDPPQVVLVAGETVTLILNNTGSVEHEFMAGTRAMSGLGYHDDWLAKAQPRGLTRHDSDHTGAGIRVAPHATAKLILIVPTQAGQFEFGCFVAGHYEGGMRGVIVVAGGPEPTMPPLRSGGTSTPSTSDHPMGMDEEQH